MISQLNHKAPRLKYYLYKYLILLYPNFLIKYKYDGQKNYFLITGSGRSGTIWLKKCLALSRGAIVEHEPVPFEYNAHIATVMNPGKNRSYLEWRKKEILIRLQSHAGNFSHYGEVNSLLRRHAHVIKEYFPMVKLIHLVRDPRNVIVSHLNRKALSSKHPFYGKFSPLPTDTGDFTWSSATELEKLCWLWQWDNSYLRRVIGHSVKFEDIVKDFELFKEKILEPLGLDLDYNEWDRIRKEPANRSKNNTITNFDSWTEADKHTLYQICGNEMRVYGYTEHNKKY